MYGSPIATLEHLLRAEAFYVSMFRGQAPSWSQQADSVPITVAAMQGWATDLAAGWEEVLSSPQPAERSLSRRRSEGSITEMPAGVMLAQALHHGNVHREQVCSVLTSQELQPPDLSAWAYAYATGRIER